jgi:hypothetical protein
VAGGFFVIKFVQIFKYLELFRAFRAFIERALINIETHVLIKALSIKALKALLFKSMFLWYYLLPVNLSEAYKNHTLHLYLF